MSLEWNDVVLKDVLSEKGYIRGPFGSALKRAEMKSEGIPVYEQQNAIYDNRIFRYYIDEEKYQSLKRFTTYTDDLIISCSGTVGKVSIIKHDDPKGIISQALLTLRVNKDLILPEFLKYFFSSYEGYNSLVSRATGSVQVNISKRAVIEEIPLKLPPLDVQRKIVHYLSLIDKKIETNEKINKNLELYLFYIFDETFMNFEFNEFSNSQDKIPLSWNLGTFNDIIESLGSGDWGKDELTGNYTSEVYCIRGADIPDVKQGNKGKMPIRYILSKNFQNKKLNENTIVLEISGGSPTQSTGRTVFITEDFLNRFDKDLICTNFCKVIKPALNYEIFIYLYFNYLYDKDVMFAYENGTTGIKNFDIKSFINNFLIVIPSQEDVINFNKLVKDVFDILMHNGLEIEKLQQLRDTLLPKLMSGEIDVSKINCDLE